MNRLGVALSLIGEVMFEPGKRQVDVMSRTGRPMMVHWMGRPVVGPMPQHVSPVNQVALRVHVFVGWLPRHAIAPSRPVDVADQVATTMSISLDFTDPVPPSALGLLVGAAPVGGPAFCSSTRLYHTT
jgi:hypothetical protein